MTSDERIARLEKQIELLNGHILATQHAVRALIQMHPDPKAAATHVEQQLEEQVAKSLASRHTSEPQIRALESAKALILPKK